MSAHAQVDVIKVRADIIVLVMLVIEGAVTVGVMDTGIQHWCGYCSGGDHVMRSRGGEGGRGFKLPPLSPEGRILE